MFAHAKVLTDGANQIIRLPDEIRFDADEVCVKRVGDAVVLFPKGSPWDVMASTLGEADDDFMKDRAQPTRPDKRHRL